MKAAAVRVYTVYKTGERRRRLCMYVCPGRAASFYSETSRVTISEKPTSVRQFTARVAINLCGRRAAAGRARSQLHHGPR